MNALFVIAPYKYLGMWVFDDERRGLVQEPFVGGADTIIDAMTAHIPNAEAGFRLIFSADPFPEYTLHLTWLRSDMGGNIYYSPYLDMEGWLCPALLRYFDKPPHRLYARVAALESPQ